jgi:hypothetical protein
MFLADIFGPWSLPVFLLCTMKRGRLLHHASSAMMLCLDENL